MSGLDEYRKNIDRIDEDIIRLLSERMEIVEKIAEYKKENNLPILDSSRERDKLTVLSAKVDGDMKQYVRSLYSLMFELSRMHQSNIVSDTSSLLETIEAAVNNTDREFPKDARVACQGVEGAYSCEAALKMFRYPDITFCDTFEGVLEAVEKGESRYGVLPIENSTAGSVRKVYDLLLKGGFYIVKSARLQICHDLLTNDGVALSDIKEILSHPQAINQCSEFLSSLDGIKITEYENTAKAAEYVKNSGRKDVASLSSSICAELYGLNTLKKSVQNSDNNHTRFICVSKVPEIYPGASRTSFMMSLPHRPGALYTVLSRFYSIGVNLIKLESTPIPGRDFEFMFYFDVQTDINSDEFKKLISSAEKIGNDFRYLGSYSEVL